MLLVGGGNYTLLTLNSFYFRLYAKDVFLGLVLRVRVRICYALARNLALLAILISTRLVSAILYSRYNSRRATAIKDHTGRTFLYTIGALMALITPWSASISGSISGRPLIRVCPQLGAGGAVDIREYPAGGWLNT
jgi:hypothetical protein